MRSRRKILAITALLLFLLMPLVILLFDPGAANLQARQSFCPFKMLTGLPCPGCGMVKSMVSLYRGEWIESLEFHLFGPVLVLFFACALVVMTAGLIRGKDYSCLLYTSDAADDLLCVDLGGRRIIKKKKKIQKKNTYITRKQQVRVT